MEGPPIGRGVSPDRGLWNGVLYWGTLNGVPDWVSGVPRLGGIPIIKIHVMKLRATLLFWLNASIRISTRSVF